MSATLHLAPNVSVIAVQTGVFLASAVVVQKYFVTPYLKLKKSRTNATQGGFQELETSVNTLKTSETEMRVSLKEAKQKASSITDAAKQKVKEYIEAEFAVVKTQADSSVAEAMESLKVNLKEEHEKMPSTVKDVSEKIIKKVLAP